MKRPLRTSPVPPIRLRQRHSVSVFWPVLLTLCAAFLGFVGYTAAYAASILITTIWR